jgi:hypothetical protein
MTIRNYLIRRSDRYATLAAVFLLAVGVAAGYAPRILAIRIVFAVLVCVILAAVLEPVRNSVPKLRKAHGQRRLLG